MKFFSFSSTKNGIIAGVLLAVGYFLWIVVPSILNNSTPLELVSCTSEEGCVKEVSQMPESSMLFWLKEDLVSGFPMMFFLLVVPIIIGFFSEKRNEMPPAKRATAVGFSIAAVYIIGNVLF